MKTRSTAIVCLACAPLAILPADRSHAAPSSEPTVISIEPPVIQTILPPGPEQGRTIASTGCALCHSPRYILNQPPFPRQTWINEVTKMRTVFGAPLPEDQVPALVDYLVAIRGK